MTQTTRSAESLVSPKDRPEEGKSGAAACAAEVVAAYHQRTKHRLERYAAGPETLDWSAQPDPFRNFAGAPRVRLPLTANRLEASFAALRMRGALTPQPLGIDTLGALLELSLGLSAWKEYGPDRWALRCTPSSGNLHPTEAYLICRRIAGVEDGVYHYLSRDHVLEQRARIEPPEGDAPAALLVGLTSILWREAWKYGERAFRYCQLDTGHALGALRYAAAALGWSLQLVDRAGAAEIGDWLGLDRDRDFGGAEREEPELLVEVTTGDVPGRFEPWPAARLRWSGRANVLDPRPMYRWPVIGEVASATVLTTGRNPQAGHPWPAALASVQSATSEAGRASVSSRDPRLGPIGDVAPAGTKPGSHSRTSVRETSPALSHDGDLRAVDIIRGRRSAQRFDATAVQDAGSFYRLLDALLPRAAIPWEVWNFEPRVHPILFVHRVEGLAPGLYALPRTVAAHTALRGALGAGLTWTRPEGCPDHLPLFLLAEAHCRKIARTVSCHQAIAADGTFALAMLAEFDAPVRAEPWRYRQLHWEAGLLGQVLYLEAEAAGLRGTGIGCFFDDAVHELLGLGDSTFQSLYHFTVGVPLVDTRIASLPPYPESE